MIPVAAIAGIVMIVVAGLLTGHNGVVSGAGMSLIAGIGGFKLKGTKAGQLLDLILTKPKDRR